MNDSPRTYAEVLASVQDQHADLLAGAPCNDSYAALCDRIESLTEAICRQRGIPIPTDQMPLRGMR